MIVGYNFFGYQEGCVWDTPICTDMLDELEMREGVYDEVYINLDTTIPDNTAKPTFWTFTTIMNSKFTGDLDAGSIGAEGFHVTHIQLYRTVYGTNKWEVIGQFEYNEDFNVYDYVDRYVQNGSLYQYAGVPVANEVLGDKLISDTILVSYEGIFVTDKKENRRLEYDINLGDMTHNTESALNQPINSQFPIVVFGQSKYRSGTLTTLPLSRETIALNGDGIDKIAEQIHRQEWVDLLNNGRAKVLRMDNGIIMLIVTQNVIVAHKQEDGLRNLATISFDYTEIGELDFGRMIKNDLIPAEHASKMVYDDFGGIVSEQ